MLQTGKKALGKLGEEVACDFLQSRGHRVLERNWRGGHLEVDIISESQDGLHFVEVKSCTAPLTSDPQEKVNSLKQRRISAAALKYLNEHGRDREVFFDVISVIFDGENTFVKYFPQAWIPLYV